MEVLKRPIRNTCFKYIVTPKEAYFVACQKEHGCPRIIDVLAEVFLLEYRDVQEKVEKGIDEGRVILGFFDPSDGDPKVYSPLELTDYVIERLEECLFGGGRWE